MGVALYRKYRSRKLSDIFGQEHVTKLLSNAISSDKLAHAYLFTGPRGVGKTSIARILAHEINGLAYDDESTHLDIIEIDAASNNGVEDIRDLRDRVQIAPVQSKKKIYIIDEVHMLSKQAFNALLKTLEEPPEHVVFILATTDIEKVPETIISRTQRHTFRRATEADIIQNLQNIADAEKIKADADALRLIARHADGSFRDSVSLFDQLMSGAEGGHITVEHTTSSLGIVSTDQVSQLIEATLANDIAKINTELQKLESEGISSKNTAVQLTDFLRRHIADNPSYMQLIDDLLDVSKSFQPELKLLTVLSLFAKPNADGPLMTSPAPLPPKPQAPSPQAPRPARTSPAKHPAAKPSSAKTPTSEVSEPAPRKRPTEKREFNWVTLTAHVKTHHVALHSVLSKCEPELDGDVLRLYTKSAFYKKKLDDTRYRGLLLDSLAEVGCDFEIETIAEAKPLKDSQAAQVAAIMGGGEEVSVEDA